jgi:hypothetical protein
MSEIDMQIVDLEAAENGEPSRLGGDMDRPRVADDFAAIHARVVELRRERSANKRVIRPKVLSSGPSEAIPPEQLEPEYRRRSSSCGRSNKASSRVPCSRPHSGGTAPAHPVAHRFAHDELEVAVLEPRQLLGEHRHAAPPPKASLNPVNPADVTKIGPPSHT